ncbi:hypothetical protein JCM10213_005766 [Rhodosporidiobolus nylandii]
MPARSTLLVAAFATLTAVDSALAAPAAANGCFSATYATCSSARSSGATSCVSGYFLTSAGRCMAAANIPTGFYGSSDGRLVSCGSGVQSCTEAGVTACLDLHGLLFEHVQDLLERPVECCVELVSLFSSSVASALLIARFPSLPRSSTGNYLTGGRCMPASAVPAGSYGGSDGALHKCSTGQATCTEVGPVTCKSGYQLSSDGSSCDLLPTCPSHTICDSTGATTSCETGFWRYGQQCLEACPAGVKQYPTTMTCYADACPARTWSYVLNENSCDGPCPQKWIDQKDICFDCGQNVQTCDVNGARTCISSEYKPWRLDTGLARDCAYYGCPDGQYAEGYSTSCVTCPPGAVTCLPVDGAALECEAPYFRTAIRQCVLTCPRGTAANPNHPWYGRYCQGCANIAHMVSCDLNGDALECDPGYVPTSVPYTNKQCLPAPASAP